MDVLPGDAVLRHCPRLRGGDAAAILVALLGAGAVALRLGRETAYLQRLESADQATRIEAIRALGELGSKKAVSLVKCMSSLDFAERLACLEALESIRPRAGDELVATLVTSSDNSSESFPPDQRERLESAARSVLRKMGREVVSPLVGASLVEEWLRLAGEGATERRRLPSPHAGFRE